MTEIEIISRSIPAKARSGYYQGSGSIVQGGVHAGQTVDISGKLDAAVFYKAFALEFDEADPSVLTGIKALAGLHTDQYLSALGLGPSGGGGGGTSYDRLDAWADYSAEKAGWVLSAALGEDLNTRVAALEGGAGKVSLAGITDLHSTWDALLKAAKPATLAGYGIEDAYTKSAADGRYVLKTGDMMTGTLRVRSASNPYGALLTGDSSSGYLQLGNMADNAGSHNGVICGPGGTYIERLRIHATNTSIEGKLGIGITLPAYDLHVNGSGYFSNTLTVKNNIIVTSASSAYGVRLTGDASTGYVQFGEIGNTQGTHNGIMCGYFNTNLTSLNVKGTTNDVLKVNNYTVLNTGNYASTLDSRYVKKSGDTMTGVLRIAEGTTSNLKGIQTSDGSQALLAHIGNDSYVARKTGTTRIRSGATNLLHSRNGTDYTIWDSFNDGSGSGLDADLLDGQHLGALANQVTKNFIFPDFESFGTATDNSSYYTNIEKWVQTNYSGKEAMFFGRGRPNVMGILIGHKYDSAGNTNGFPQYCSFLYSNLGGVVYTFGTNNYTQYSYQLARITDNVYSATKLQTARTLWGRPFDGTANVSGNMTGVGSITASDYIYSVGGWFQCNTNGRGLYNLAQDARWYANGGAWNTDKPILPETNNTLGIGNSNYRFNYGYFTNLNTNGLAVTGNATLNGLVTCNNNIVFNKAPIVNTGARYLYFGSNYDYGRIGWEDSTNFYIQGVSAGGTMHLCARNTGKLAVIDMQADSVNLSDNLTAQGTIYSKIGVYSDGYMSCLGVDSTSDARLKEVLRPVRISLEAMANAPAVAFRWKSGRGEDIGGLAQYWQGVEPLAVKAGKEGWLTMNYAGLAYVNTVSMAGELLALRDEVRTLREEVRQMKANRAA